MQKLNVDGLIRGEVTEFERLFVGIYAEIRLGVTLEIIDINGVSIWQGQFEVSSRAGGISTSPWGLLMNSVLAALHLEDENLYAAADKLGRKIRGAIPEPAGFSPEAGPRIDGVLHDAVNKSLKYGDILTVGLHGEPNNTATFMLQDIGQFDLLETQPGEYIGKVPISKSWEITDKMIIGQLRNNLGVSSKWISPLGLITIDNTSPEPPTQLFVSAMGDKLELQWSTVTGAQKYQLRPVDAERGTNEIWVDKTSAELPIVPLFVSQVWEVTAYDYAQNASVPARIQVTNYPDPVVARAEKIAELRGEINKNSILTRQYSPYIVRESINLKTDTHLFIEPGVKLIFAQNASIISRGIIKTWSNDDPVIMNAQIKGSNSTYIHQAAGRLELNSVQIKDAGIAIQSDSGSVFLDNVEFDNNVFSALSLSGDTSVTAKQIIVRGSNTGGIVLTEQSKLTMMGSTFSNNSPFNIQNASSYPVLIGSPLWLPEGTKPAIIGKWENQ
jgi:hypothetical protein